MAPDTDLFEDVFENQKDAIHLSGDSGIRLSPEPLATYAGVYELAPGREVVVRVTGDILFVKGLNEPKLPLLVQSETQFMSTATPTGFEFVKDAPGKVTHLMVCGEVGDQKRAPQRRLRSGSAKLTAVGDTDGLMVMVAPRERFAHAAPSGAMICVPGQPPRRSSRASKIESCEAQAVFGDLLGRE